MIPPGTACRFVFRVASFRQIVAAVLVNSLYFFRSFDIGRALSCPPSRCRAASSNADGAGKSDTPSAFLLPDRMAPALFRYGISISSIAVSGR